MSFTKDFTQQQIYLIYTKIFFVYINSYINILVIRLCDSRHHQVFEQSEIIKKKSKLFYLIIFVLRFDNFGGCT